MAEDSVHLIEDSGTIGIQAIFKFMEDKHALSETPSLRESVYSHNVEIIYDEKEQKWLVEKSASIWASSITPTKTFKGSGTIYQPSGDTVQAEKERLVKNELQSFMEHYVSQSVYAINDRNFSHAEDLITNDGPRKKEARDYIDYLETKGITEQFISSYVDKVEAAGTNTWKVTTTEEFIIYYPDSSKTKRFTATVLVKKVDGDWRVHELVETKEI